MSVTSFSLQAKPKGVSGLIEIENPNRVAQKMKKASDVQLNDDTTSQLSRRERYCNNLVVLHHMLDTKKECLELTTRKIILYTRFPNYKKHYVLYKVYY